MLTRKTKKKIGKQVFFVGLVIIFEARKLFFEYGKKSKGYDRELNLYVIFFGLKIFAGCGIAMMAVGQRNKNNWQEKRNHKFPSKSGTYNFQSIKGEKSNV